MRGVEATLLWAAVAAWVAALLLSLIGQVFRKERLVSLAGMALPVALALHAGAFVGRWLESGHMPVMGVYENSLAGSLFLGALYGTIHLRMPSARRALPIAVFLVLLLVGNGVTVRDPAVPLEPPFRSGWLFVHVIFAWLSFGAYLLAAVLAGAYLVARRGQAEEDGPSALLSDTAGRMVVFGFVTDTVMIASGALWADGLWGRYWGWDPIETWSLICWLLYGANLHLRFTLGWDGRRLAWLTVLSVPAVIITFFGVQFVSDVHTELL